MNKIRKAVYDAVIRATGLDAGDCFWHDHPEHKCYLKDISPDNCIDGMCWCADILRDAEKAIMEAKDEDLDEHGLKKMMRDPRYWRDSDPEIVARVRDGFRKLYPND